MEGFLIASIVTSNVEEEGKGAVGFELSRTLLSYFWTKEDWKWGCKIAKDERLDSLLYYYATRQIYEARRKFREEKRFRRYVFVIGEVHPDSVAVFEPRLGFVDPLWLEKALEFRAWKHRKCLRKLAAGPALVAGGGFEPPTSGL